jgi:hypothetical protein
VVVRKPRGILITLLYLALMAFDHQALSDAQRLFYNGRYDAAAAMTVELCARQPPDLAAFELRTSALLFQLKAALDDGHDGDRHDRDAAFARCLTCPGLMAAFLSDTTEGQKMARARLAADPADEAARFFLGKLDLNYVWLQLGELGHRTGWSEYWEARTSLDAVLLRNPKHIRARVARAWIDYIVDTKMPRGTRWVLGGGNRKRALAVVREAAAEDTDFFVHAEAAFALWDLQIRERNVAGAVVTARDLARDFPDNRQLSVFLERHGSPQS